MALAEAQDLAADIGRFVLAAACRSAVGWPADLYVAVDVPPGAFEAPGLVDDLAFELGRTGLLAGRLVLELATATTGRDPDTVAARILALRSLGIRAGVNGVGTRSSALDHLRRLPLDMLKLDRSLVRDLETNPRARSVTAALVCLGRAFGMAVVAEGVETLAQREAVASLGCDGAQGHGCSPPLPPAEFAEFVAAWRSRTVSVEPS